MFFNSMFLLDNNSFGYVSENRGQFLLGKIFTYIYDSVSKEVKELI